MAVTLASNPVDYIRAVTAAMHDTVAVTSGQGHLRHADLLRRALAVHFGTPPPPEDAVTTGPVAALVAAAGAGPVALGPGFTPLTVEEAVATVAEYPTLDWMAFQNVGRLSQCFHCTSPLCVEDDQSLPWWCPSCARSGCTHCRQDHGDRCVHPDGSQGCDVTTLLPLRLTNVFGTRACDVCHATIYEGDPDAWGAGGDETDDSRDVCGACVNTVAGAAIIAEDGLIPRQRDELQGLNELTVFGALGKWLPLARGPLPADAEGLDEPGVDTPRSAGVVTLLGRVAPGEFHGTAATAEAAVVVTLSGHWPYTPALGFALRDPLAVCLGAASPAALLASNGFRRSAAYTSDVVDAWTQGTIRHASFCIMFGTPLELFHGADSDSDSEADSDPNPNSPASTSLSQTPPQTP
jgi:hypothetical protein